uniref:Uncharacterized protein n=1 Tax=Chaetoceros debilis TaxID=122233 RepID=A0A7S3PUC0_9STRA|mmetsp:Transcript_11685/g.17076  ORF Transcript_11685/g.17076 Transcript_11685/m.17076 type:complete len:626 (+) Transcript_11685:66-1943(+)
MSLPPSSSVGQSKTASHTLKQFERHSEAGSHINSDCNLFERETQKLEMTLTNCLEEKEAWKVKADTLIQENEVEASVKHLKAETDYLLEQAEVLLNENDTLAKQKDGLEETVSRVNIEKDALIEENKRLQDRLKRVEEETIVSGMNTVTSGKKDNKPMNMKEEMGQQNVEEYTLNGVKEFYRLPIPTKKDDKGCGQNANNEGVEKMQRDVLKKVEDEMKEKNALITQMKDTMEGKLSEINELKGDCTEMVETLQQMQEENDLLRAACSWDDIGDMIAHQQREIKSHLDTIDHLRRRLIEEDQKNGNSLDGSTIESQELTIDRQATVILNLEMAGAEMEAKVQEFQGDNKVLRGLLEEEETEDKSEVSVSLGDLMERLELLEEMKDEEIAILTEEKRGCDAQMKRTEKSMRNHIQSLVEENQDLMERFELLEEMKDKEIAILVEEKKEWDAQMKERDELRKELAANKKNILTLEDRINILSGVNAGIVAEVEKLKKQNRNKKKSLAERLAAYEERSCSGSVSMIRLRSRIVSRQDDSSVISGMSMSGISIVTEKIQQEREGPEINPKEMSRPNRLTRSKPRRIKSPPMNSRRKSFRREDIPIEKKYTIPKSVSLINKKSSTVIANK